MRLILMQLRRKQLKLPEKCVAIENVKAHYPDDLPLHKGDVVELLDVDRDTARLKGMIARITRLTC